MKFLFFDLDDTLLDFHKAEAWALRQALSQAGIVPTDAIVARYSEINQSQWELLEEKKLTREQVLIRRFQLLFQELGVHASCEETQHCYENMLAKGHDFMPGAPELLETLNGNYQLYLVSNGTAMVQDCRLRDSGIEKYFQGIFISERIGVDKPQKEFFDRSFAMIPDFDPSQAMIIGDSLTSDIRGGNNAGIQTCWYNPKHKPRRTDIHVDYEISDLMELPKLLETL
jgi:2-haloacid dehalogenase